MAQLKIRVHPLFFIFGIYFALIGKVFSFIIFTLTAIIHELGHYLASSKCGYKLNKITLMPFGALLSGGIEAIKYKDECKIALAGPLTNFCVAIFFVALWWFIPDVYPLTDLVVLSNISLALINLLPCYPLDGGRFLFATLSLIFSKKVSNFIARGLSIILSLLFLGLFILTANKNFNLTLLFFSLFMLIGGFSKSKENKYVKLYESINFENFNQPKLVKRLVISGENTVKSLYKIIDYNYYYEFLIYDNGDSRLLKGKELQEVLCNKNIYEKLKNCI